MKWRVDLYWVLTDLNEGYWVCKHCDKPVGSGYPNHCTCPEEVKQYNEETQKGGA